MKRLVFDIETNHYDFTIMDRLHCMATLDVDTEEEKLYVGMDEVSEGLKELCKADLIIAHNGIRFDLPALQIFFPEFKPNNIFRDTLIMSRMYRPKWFVHGLAKWGQVLRFKKGDYADEFKKNAGDSYVDGDEWLTYTDSMGAYCLQDVRVNRRVYLECLKGMPYFYNEDSLELEQYTTWLMCKQKAEGVWFNEAKAEPLMLDLIDKKEALHKYLCEAFGGFYKQGKTMTPKVNRKDLGYVKGSPFTKIVWTEFNPGSSDHVIYWLKKKYQWEPEEFTKKGTPKVTYEVLEALANVYPEAQPLYEYAVTDKRLSFITGAKGSWFNKVTKEGRIHGTVNPQGTVTYRGSHSDPNLGQIPKVQKDKEGSILYGLEGGYGAECRELFSHGMGPTWKFMGCDMSGIEFRLLAHYLYQFDDGALADTVLHGDIHSLNQKAAGLPTRDLAKTFIYAFIYGGGDFKLGSIVGKGRAEGGRLRAKFLKGMPAIATIIARLTQYRKENKGYIRGIDGRHFPVDHAHTILNYLLQSAGAILSKEWMRMFHHMAEEAGFTWGKDYMQLLWVHDEVQCAVKSSRADELGKICVKAIEKVGERYNLNCPITGEYQLGDNWKETH